ncbi:MAG: cobalt-precorrin-5B (C(1))-methyltransferase CbiD [Oscillospiraceae bacterium]|nr:cobalt-precorrin-5B (C(1))-methyltransferase CbiD [Oscillospiraceae bacterium]
MYRNVKGKLLRRGYTTGSCAAAAAKAAVGILLAPRSEDGYGGSVELDTPKGVKLTLDIADTAARENSVSCAVRKDSGDDPDVTNGALVYATVRKIPNGITIDGGEGVGRVTKPGLDQPPGAAAINSTPRRMITEAVSAVCAEYGYSGGIEVIVSVPDGAELAARTFNPRLGIEGGISILGTTGIVEPMSIKALADSIRLEVSQLSAAGSVNMLITPGNYGETFTRDTLKLPLDDHIRCADFIGETLDFAAEYGFKNILLVSHIGKLVKLGIGAFNTHYSYGDGRMETLTACALEAGADIEVLRRIMECVMSDAAVDVLRESGLLEPAMKILGDRAYANLRRRVPVEVNVGYICFTNVGNVVLAQSDNAAELTEIWRNR